MASKHAYRDEQPQRAVEVADGTRLARRPDDPDPGLSDCPSPAQIAVARWVCDSTSAQGLPVQVHDSDLLLEVARMLRSAALPEVKAKPCDELVGGLRRTTDAASAPQPAA